MAADGGEESRVLDHGYMGYWTLMGDDICILNREAPQQPALEFFDFKTRQVTQLSRVGKTKSTGGSPGLSVSSDGRWILFRQVDQLESDIMLVENFR